MQRGAGGAIARTRPPQSLKSLNLGLHRCEYPDATASAHAFRDVDMVGLGIDRDRMRAAGGGYFLDQLVGLGIDHAERRSFAISGRGGVIKPEADIGPRHIAAADARNGLRHLEGLD